MKSLHVIHTPEIRDSRNRGHPPRKSLTPGDGSLMPPAILSGRSTRSRKTQCCNFAASRLRVKPDPVESHGKMALIRPGLCLTQPLKPHAKP